MSKYESRKAAIKYARGCWPLSMQKNGYSKGELIQIRHFAVEDYYAGFLAGAQLILDRLKATEKGDLGDRKTADVWDTSTADYNSGRASVRREVLGDE